MASDGFVYKLGQVEARIFTLFWALLFLSYQMFLTLSPEGNLEIKGVLLLLSVSILWLPLIRRGFKGGGVNFRFVVLLVFLLLSFLGYLNNSLDLSLGYYVLKLFLLVSFAVFFSCLGEQEFKDFFNYVAVIFFCLLPLLFLVGSINGIYMLLPFLVINRKNKMVRLACFLMIIVSYILVARVFMILFFMLFLFSLLENNKVFNVRNFTYFLLCLAGMLFFLQLYVGLYHGFDYNLNSILTKRPFIWGVYLSYIGDADLFNQIFGAGRIDLYVAEEVGALVAEDFEYSNNYSSHSMLINIVYEYGVLGGGVVLGMMFFLVAKGVDLYSDFSLLMAFFLLSGVVLPIDFLGVSGISVVVTMLFAFFLMKVPGSYPEAELVKG